MKFVFYNGSDGVYKLVTNTATLSGGATKQQWLLAQTLIANGHDAIFVTPTSNPEKLIREIGGIRFIPSPRRTTNLTLKYIFDKEKPAWLYWRSNSLHLGPCFFMAKTTGAALAYACASDKDCHPKRALNPYSFQRHLWPFYQWGLNQADRILIQHMGQRDLFSNRYAAKSHLVKNIATITNIKKDLGNTPYIVWVGNIRYEKRADILVDIADQLPQYKFVVCGAMLEYRSEPGYVQSVKQRLSSLANVEYFGAVSPEETIRIIANATLLLSTSEQEGFPNTMLEAWSVGVPVVSLRLGLGGTISRHDIGLVTDNISNTIISLKHLMNDSRRLKQMGENGKRYILENHSSSTVYDQLEVALSLSYCTK